MCCGGEKACGGICLSVAQCSRSKMQRRGSVGTMVKLASGGWGKRSLQELAMVWAEISEREHPQIRDFRYSTPRV